VGIELSLRCCPLVVIVGQRKDPPPGLCILGGAPLRGNYKGRVDLQRCQPSAFMEIKIFQKRVEAYIPGFAAGGEYPTQKAAHISK